MRPPRWRVTSTSPPAASRPLRPSLAAGIRARRRIRGNAPSPERDLRQQRHVVEAFLSAARDGNVERLLTLLDPDIVVRADGGALSGFNRVVQRPVLEQAATFSKIGLLNQIVLVNGSVGLVSRLPDGRVFSVIGLTIAEGRIATMDILADPERIGRLDLSAIEGPR